MRVKLTGFRSAVIYYDEKKDDINYQPCIPLKQKKVEEYKAPEVFGNPKKEQYDPVAADVWSFAATIFHLLTRKYPYDTKVSVFSATDS